MLKSAIAALCFLVLGSTAFAGNVSPLTGPNDPSQMKAVINSLIVSGNASWNLGGETFTYSNVISAVSSATVSFTSAAGPAGLVTPGIAAWLKIPNAAVSRAITNGVPKYYLIPLWSTN